MAKGTPPKDARFKRFRTAAYGIYIVIVTVFSALIIYSIFKSVLQMTPRATENAEKQLTERECVDGVDALWRKLDAKRRGFTDEHPAKAVDQEFSRFRIGWLKELRDLEARCAVESRNREALKKLFRRVGKLQALYTTHAVQFAGEVGPEVDRLEETFAAARKEAQGR